MDRDTAELRNAPPVDRAVLALTQLQMTWERTGKEDITDEMLSDAARSWAIDADEEHEIATFLCDFVMQLRSGEFDDDDDDNF